MIELPANYNALNRRQRNEVRLRYVEIQDGKCWHCKGNLDEPPAEEAAKFKPNPKWFPQGFFNNPIHLQHDHVTGLTEGAVHAHCNAVLWEFFGR